MITGKFEIEEREGEVWLRFTNVDDESCTPEENLLFKEDLEPLTDNIDYEIDDKFYDENHDNYEGQLDLDWGD